jgi:hypothetical protein
MTRILFVLIFLALSGLAGWRALDAFAASEMAAGPDQAWRVYEAEAPPVTASPLFLSTLADRALRGEPPAPELAVSALRRALELEPRDGEMWARLAHALLRAGAPPEEVVAAMQASYDRMPGSSRTFRRWRLQLAESIWAILPLELRGRVLGEAQQERLYWLAEYAPAIAAEI